MGQSGKHLHPGPGGVQNGPFPDPGRWSSSRGTSARVQPLGRWRNRRFQADLNVTGIPAFQGRQTGLPSYISAQITPNNTRLSWARKAMLKTAKKGEKRDPVAPKAPQSSRKPPRIPVTMDETPGGWTRSQANMTSHGQMGVLKCWKARTPPNNK